MQEFLEKLALFPSGYGVAMFRGAKWGVTVQRLGQGRQIKLYGDELGGADHVSFNLYLPSSGSVLLKPCEMPDEKVIRFVLEAQLIRHENPVITGTGDEGEVSA